MNFLTRLRQWVQRITDTRRPAALPCRACKQLPIQTFIDADQHQIAHLTCANPACTAPVWTDPAVKKRTIAEAISEWNGLNREEDPAITWAQFARAGQIDADLNVWSDELLRQMAAEKPDVFKYVLTKFTSADDGGVESGVVGVLFMRADIATMLERDRDDTDADLDDSHPLARSSRSEFQKRRAQPPDTTRGSVSFGFSRQQFDDDEKGS